MLVLCSVFRFESVFWFCMWPFCCFRPTVRQYIEYELKTPEYLEDTAPAITTTMTTIHQIAKCTENPIATTSTAITITTNGNKMWIQWRKKANGMNLWWNFSTHRLETNERALSCDRLEKRTTTTLLCLAPSLRCCCARSGLIWLGC